MGLGPLDPLGALGVSAGVGVLGSGSGGGGSRLGLKISRCCLFISRLP